MYLTSKLGTQKFLEDTNMNSAGAIPSLNING